MATIFIGRKDQREAISEAIDKYLGEGHGRAKMDVLTHGSLRAGESIHWVGIEPVTGDVNLVSPGMVEGDAPGEWLLMGVDGNGVGQYANTSDLAAVRVE